MVSSSRKNPARFIYIPIACGRPSEDGLRAARQKTAGNARRPPESSHLCRLRADAADATACRSVTRNNEKCLEIRAEVGFALFICWRRVLLHVSAVGAHRPLPQTLTFTRRGVGSCRFECACRSAFAHLFARGFCFSPLFSRHFLAQRRDTRTCIRRSSVRRRPPAHSLPKSLTFGSNAP